MADSVVEESPNLRRACCLSIILGFCTTALLFLFPTLFIIEAGQVGESFIRTNQAVTMHLGEIQKIKHELYFDEMLLFGQKIRRWYKCEGSIGTGTIGVSMTKEKGGWTLNRMVLRLEGEREIELPLK